MLPKVKEKRKKIPLTLANNFFVLCVFVAETVNTTIPFSFQGIRFSPVLFKSFCTFLTFGSNRCAKNLKQAIHNF